MPQNKSFIFGGNAPRLNQLDPDFSYQDISEFQLIKGPRLEDIVSNLPHDEYEIEKPRDNNYSPSNISKIIWDFLNSRPGKIRHSGSRPNYGANEEKYIQKIINSIKRGRPIELFLMNFSPKFANPLISGDDISPDLSNLLALQHLTDIARPIREIYEPGIRFVIVYEGGIYQELGKFSDEEVQRSYQHIKTYCRLIEEKEGISGVVEVVDGKKLVEALGTEFIDALRKEGDRLDKLYKDKNHIDFIHQFDEWRNKFALNIINLDKLLKGELDHASFTLNEWLRILNDSPEKDSFLRKVRDLVHEASYKMAIDYFAFHNLKYSFGSKKLGIMQNYPDAMQVTVRADKKRLAPQLIPGTSMYPHHGITVWTGKRWEVTKLIDLARYPNQFVGVVLSEKENVGRSPFYYLLKDADCPKFTKPVMPIEEVFPLILLKRGYRMLKDLSRKGTMDSRLFLAQDSNDKKVVIKYSSVEGFQGNGRPVLQKEAKRLEDIARILGPQRVFPEISEYCNDDNITYYVMSFFSDSETVTDYLARLPDGKSYVEEARKITHKLLTVLSKKVYSKGKQETPKKYLSIWHLDRLKQGVQLLVDNQSDIFSSYIKDKKFKVGNIEHRDLTEFFRKVFACKKIIINGVEFLNFPHLLNIIQRNEKEMNKKLNPAKIPLITHGDLHFSNILRNIQGELLLIDPYGKRPINAVEGELGRIALSFFADFLRKRNYNINIHFGENSELEISLYYIGNNKDLILDMSKARDAMLDIIAKHRGIYKWIKDTEDWQSHVLLMEAIHIPVVAANKFTIDNSGKLTLGCYIIGTVLMNNVLARMGFINPEYEIISSPMELFLPDRRYDFQKGQFVTKLTGDKTSTENGLDYIIKSLGKVRKHGMDKNTYLDLQKSFETQRKIGLIKDMYLLELESHYVMMLTTKDGRKLGVRLLPIKFSDNINPIEILPIAGEYKFELVKTEDVLVEWQRVNFPETKVSLFNDYTESEVFNSLQKGTPISICGNFYKVVELLGLGKESKVFKAINVKTNEIVALKVGLISLKKEIEYLKEIKRNLKGHKDVEWFPEYLNFDEEKNIIVMEYINGQTLEENLSQRLKKGKDLEQLLLFYAETVQKVCKLRENHNILYGQFNLRNILVDQDGSMRFLDPLYPLSSEKYDTLQIIRIGAILMETFYGLRDNEFSEKVKSATNLEKLRSTSISDSLWGKLEENHLPTKYLIDYKVKDIIKKCLVPQLRIQSLGDLREQFEELKNLIYACFPKLNSERKNKIRLHMLRKFNEYITKKYRAVALDFNNTISFTEETNTYLLEKIIQLLKRKIHVAIISGRRAVWTDNFMKEIQPFLQDKKDNILRRLHFYNSEGAIGCNIGTREIYYEKLFDPKLMIEVKEIIQINFPQINFQTQFRTDGYRLNFDSVVDVDELNELFKKRGLAINALTSGTSIDVVPRGVNKGTALNDFASRLGININDIVKIADQGQRNGNDNSLLSGSGAFSINNYEPNSNQVSTVEVLGLKKVFATAWLLDNLKFRSELK